MDIKGNRIMIGITVVVLMLLCLLAGYAWYVERGTCAVTESEKVVYDTIRYNEPAVSVEQQLGLRRYALPNGSIIKRGERVRKSHRESADSLLSDTLNIGITTVSVAEDEESEEEWEADSDYVELAVLQRHYKDKDYEAWVSGPIDPKLDSVRIYGERHYVTKEKWKPPKRWHIGVSAGYGYGQRGFQPYIGVGLTYSLISF